MKRLILLLGLFPLTIFISGCSSLGLDGGTSSWDNYDNSMVKSLMGPTEDASQSPTHYQQSRKYYVTPEENQKYNAINDRVQKRMQEVQAQKTNDATSLPKNTIPVTSSSANE